jgi:ribonucleoside-triphosphate reductase (thioredoxin)
VSAALADAMGAALASIPPASMDERIRQIRKRDGETVQEFDIAKIRAAVAAAWTERREKKDEQTIDLVTRDVLRMLPFGVVDVELVQDVVEVALMRAKAYDVAKAYILYRQKRTEARTLRGKRPDPEAVGGYIHASKYARHRDELGRREVYEETVARVEAMHLGKFPGFEDEIRGAFDLVREKRVLPSMRSMQFAGPAILSNHGRQYNCTFGLVDHLDVFGEAIFLLLSGCGVGYSVQLDHVEKLPILVFVDPKKIKHHVIADKIEGWADAVKALVSSYVTGEYVEFSYHLVRPLGTPLKTSGGVAPGHVPLKVALERMRKVLDAAQGRRLRPIECHRIMCHGADAVLSGGVRRSAMIALFSLEDSEMMNCKTGDWFSSEPWLANANNSVAILRGSVKKKQFVRIFEMTKQWGEPGFFFSAGLDYGVNPCCEIGLYPRLTVDKSIKRRMAARGVQVAEGDVLTGWAFCNLCEINAAKFKTREDFLEAAQAATLIGTLQAAYTDMPYLGWVSEEIARRDALLGVGMTGMLDAPSVSCDPALQREVAEKIKEWNAAYAAHIGIRSAARTTCVKPSGTTSLELGCVASGHHAHHARRYIRRVIAVEMEPVFQAFREKNPHMCVRKPDGKWVIEFPVQAPDGAIVKEDLTAVGFLEMVRSTQENWVVPGTASESSAPGLTHNVSNTVTVRPHEWETVAEYLWQNQKHFSGVSLIASSGDKDYAFAPNEAVVTEADEARWNHLVTHYVPLDYAELRETADGTNLTGEAACVGGACAI